MPALVAGIHVFSAGPIKDVDGRNKSGHDDGESHVSRGLVLGHLEIKRDVLPSPLAYRRYCCSGTNGRPARRHQFSHARLIPYGPVRARTLSTSPAVRNLISPMPMA